MKTTRDFLIIAALILCLGVCTSCSPPAPEPQPPTQDPTSTVPPTNPPPTAAIVITLPTETPEPSEPVSVFMPTTRFEITKENVGGKLTQFGQLPIQMVAPILDISPDNHWVATVEGHGTSDIRIWNMHTGTQEMVLNGAWKDRLSVDYLFFLPNGVLVSHVQPIGGDWRNGGRAQYWDLESGEIIKELNCYYIKYSPDGSYYAHMPKFDEDSMVAFIVEEATGKTIQTIDPGYRIHSLIFSQDNSTLVGSTGPVWQSIYTFWDTKKGTKTNVLYDTSCLAFTERDAFVVALENQKDSEVGELVLLEQDTFDQKRISYQTKIGWSCAPAITHSTDMVIHYYYGSVQFMDAANGYPVASLQVSSDAKILLSDDHTILILAEYENNIRFFAVTE